MLTPLLIFYAVLAGMAFSLMNIFYRLGQQRGVPVQPIAFVVALAGTAYFVAATWPATFWHAPWQVWGSGVFVGLSQYLLILLIATALRHGPLSPMNCAMFLGFVLIILMSRVVWHETLNVMQEVGVAMAVLCVIVASFQTSGDRKEDSKPRTVGAWLLYAAILGGLFFINAVANAAFKILGMVPTTGPESYASLYGNHYLTMLYLTLGLCLGLDMLIKARPRGPLRWQIGLGLTTGFASIVGMSSMRLCASLPAAFTFPVAALTLILSGALVSVFYFGERTTRAWWAMLGTGGLAAGCLIADALAQRGG